MGLADERKLRKIRIALIVVGVIVVAVFGYPISKAVMAEARRAKQLKKALDRAGKPLASLSFSFKDEWLDVPPAGIRMTAPRGTCSALVGVAEGKKQPASVRIEMDGNAPVEAVSPVVWCACQETPVLVKVKGSDKTRTALRWLTVHAEKVGGIRVLSTKHVKGVTVVGTSASDGCADVVFATWSQRITGGNLLPWRRSRLPFGMELRSEGFRVLGVFGKEQPFGIVASQQGDCVLVLPVDFKGRGISLMNDDGDWLVENLNQAVGWCSYRSSVAYSLWRSKEERRDWLVVAARAGLIGGLAGIREAAERYGSPQMRAVVGEKDLVDDAVAALQGSGIPYESILRASPKGLPSKPDDLIVAFSLRRDGSYLPEVVPVVPIACEPEQDPRAPLINKVCVQARPQKWKADGAAINQGAAQGQVPFWLRLLVSVDSDGARKAAARLLAFARRMTLMGFRPTMTEGIKESSIGATVSWRDGVKQVVVVGVRASSPWLIPLFVNEPWSLEGKIPVVDLPQGKSLRFRGRVPLGHDPRRRRVIVWRR